MTAYATDADFVIVGGGTAGWLTAGLIAAQAKHPSERSKAKICVIESPRIPPIGVGEGTWPTMRATLNKIGVSEDEFVKFCDATFKQGSKFNGWVTGDEDDYYYHPFEAPADFSKINPVNAWIQSGSSDSFSNYVCAQEHVCQKHLSPKRNNSPEYSGYTNYGYHLNSGKFSAFIRTHCTDKLDVGFISDDVTSIHTNSDETIKAVETATGKVISGKVFIDCTGFSSILIGKHYKTDFHDVSKTLFVDTALAAHVPYDSSENIPSQTNSTAQSAGWIWDIGLPSRRGVGYVYSSQYIDDATAERELNAYILKTNPDIPDIEFRKIPIRSGYRKEAWVKNCVAIGLANGFLEPLEASAMIMIEVAANFIADNQTEILSDPDAFRDSFNAQSNQHWHDIIKFLKLHYVLSQRNEPFWVDNRAPETIPNDLLQALETWKTSPPSLENTEESKSLFPPASFQYILYGMGFDKPANTPRLNEAQRTLVSQQQAKIERLKVQLTKRLTHNREAMII